MKLPCEMMEDLLPLYAENMATNATRAAVEEHLEGCQSCREKLSAMRGEAPEKAPAVALEPVRRELKRRRRNVAITAVCAVAAVLLAVFSWLVKPVYLPYSEEAVRYEQQADGGYELTFDGATSFTQSVWLVMDTDVNGDSKAGRDFIAWYTLLDRWMGGGTVPISVSVGGDGPVWYVNMAQDGELVPLWGMSDDAGWSVGGKVLSRLILNYYLIFAAVAAAGLLILWFLLRRRPAGHVALRLFLLPVCYIVATGVVTGFDTVTIHASQDFLFIALIALSVWGFLMAGAQILRQKRQDSLRLRPSP